MNEAATIQKESKYPLDVIKQFSNTEQFEIAIDEYNKRNRRFGGNSNETKSN